MTAGAVGAATRRGTVYASIAALGAVVVLVAVNFGDGYGGDTADYIAIARDPLQDSRFPPGMGLVLAPVAQWFDGMRAVMAAATVGLVVAMWAAAVRLGGWWAGVVLAVFVACSPALVTDGDAVMSDRLGSLLLVAAMLAISCWRHRLAGVLAAAAGWVRLPLVAVGVGLPRRSWWTWGAGVVGLAVWMLAVQGSLTGYSSSGSASWSLGYITDPVQLEREGQAPTMSNLAYWPAVLLGGGGWVAPGVALIGVVGVWRRRRSEVARFGFGVVLVTFATLLPYFAQSARLILPAGCVLMVFAAVEIGARFSGLDAVDVPAHTFQCGGHGRSPSWNDGTNMNRR